MTDGEERPRSTVVLNVEDLLMLAASVRSVQLEQAINSEEPLYFPHLDSAWEFHFEPGQVCCNLRAAIASGSSIKCGNSNNEPPVQLHINAFYSDNDFSELQFLDQDKNEKFTFRYESASWTRLFNFCYKIPNRLVEVHSPQTGLIGSVEYKRHVDYEENVATVKNFVTGKLFTAKTVYKEGRHDGMEIYDATGRLVGLANLQTRLSSNQGYTDLDFVLELTSAGSISTTSKCLVITLFMLWVIGERESSQSGCVSGALIFALILVILSLVIFAYKV